jgi:LmbE family N-acetylglucosaminyl deacetylase
VARCVLASSADARHGRPELTRLLEMSERSARMVGVDESFAFDFPNIALNVVAHIDLVKSIEQAIVKFRPTWVFTHHSGDLNIDHRAVHDACMAAVTLPLRLHLDLRAGVLM